jgi:hypothetical protein
MVQDDDGRYLIYDLNYEEFKFLSKNSGFVTSHVDASKFATNYGGHLVEMVPAKPKVPVSQEEAEMLRKAGADGYSVGKTIVDFVNNAGLDTVICSDENLLQHEDRLIRAYVDGYTVVEPTKYNIKVPHLQGWYYYHVDDQGNILPASDKHNSDENQQFTAAEIKHYGLEDCEKEEVTDDDE